MQEFADVLLPLPVKDTFTYIIPPEMHGHVQVGSRVLVPFGSKKIYTAIVMLTHDRQPQGYRVKPLLSVLDDSPIVRHPQLKFWRWISDYYLCTVGEVYKAAVPSGLKVESETEISVNPDYEESHPGELTDRQRVIMDFTVRRGKLKITELSNATGFKNVEAQVSRMLALDAIHVSERLVDSYRPKTEVCVRLTIGRDDEQGLHRFFDDLRRAKKQEQLLMAYLDLSLWLQKSKPVQEVTRDELLKRAGVTAPVLAAARQRGVFEEYKRELNRFADIGCKSEPLPNLTDEQQQAYHEILHSFGQKDITLLHGVTSSGKTSIYMHLIDDCLRHGRQALYLVPEIALTTQLTSRLRRVMGGKLLIYHSKFSDSERVDIWKRLLHSNDPCVVIGVRSSVFLPYSNLGLIIVDEEHDTSYKQQDPAPRYNGRNAAMVLAMMHGAKTLLGSATPSLDVAYHAKQGQYGLVRLTKRYGDIKMPSVEVIDTKLSRKKHEMKGMFSQGLVERCREALKAGEQIILFQNRRGYAPMVRCKECGWIPTCKNCDVSLTYHKSLRELTCHYCGYTMSLPNLCQACGQPGIEIVGYGTERIEDEIEQVFAGEKISRMDLDTTRNKNGHERIINEFSEHKTNILVGTQMVTKGLDFDGVSIVGILNADTMISFPDFHSAERAFATMEQVAGRAGRAHKQGKVIVQTSNPEHPVIGYVAAHDYDGFYNHELQERKKFGYPPFSRVINIYMKHHNDNILTEVSVRYSNLLRGVFGQRVLGPEAPLVARVQNLYVRQIVLKMEIHASMSKVKKILRGLYEQMVGLDSRMKSTILYYDVDPV